MLKIYNSLSGKKEEFRPLTAGKIGLYVCGNTVYDYSHIGHARSMIMFDVVVRFLRSRGYQVTYVRNITDIDDKIILRANENHEPIDALTRRFIEAQNEDTQALGLLKPDVEPRATEYIPQMLELIQNLLDRDHAYIAEDGDVCFNVRSFPEYGRLSGRQVEKLKAGARIEQDAAKKDPLDFVLWKISKPGEPRWPSPWGEGRPGWHIECSAMSTSLLGQPFDIHGGGMDLKFPHHENEIAQSEAGCGKHFAQLWMHVGLLQVNGEKMSKSLGNFLTIRDALNECLPEELRLFMLNSHYSRPADYTPASLYEARHRLRSLYDSLENLPLPPKAQESSGFTEKFNAVMEEDFNTTMALAILGEIAGKIHQLREEGRLEEAADLGRTLKNLGGILGILQQDPQEYFAGAINKEDQAKIDALAHQRDLLRAQKKWDEADKIRHQLIDMGLEVLDTPTGTRTRLASK
jgi:cysteinyl-tRNA synthetase